VIKLFFFFFFLIFIIIKKGKAFYTVKNSIRMLCIVSFVFLCFDIPYLLPDFIQKSLTVYEYHLIMCITNNNYRTYMFFNNVIIYSVVPFFVLLIFNCLIILILARQQREFTHVVHLDNTTNAKRERQFKERTILLMLVTFFLVLSVTPRYATQILLSVLKINNLETLTIMKCLIILEMLNFSINFFFYIIFSKTSRSELYLILYYYFYWKWSDEPKRQCICNHLKHNRKYIHPTNGNTIGRMNSINEHQNNNQFKFSNSIKCSRMKIHCFLINYNKIKNKKSFRASITNDSTINRKPSAYNRNTTTDNNTNSTNNSIYKEKLIETNQNNN
jgi:hypothetical protein